MKNYNGVTVKESVSLKNFIKKFGNPKLAKCTNSETNEEFNSLAFIKNGNITWCHFGYSTQGMSAKDISNQADDLLVGLNSSGKYTLFKQGNDAWETIHIDMD